MAASATLPVHVLAYGCLTPFGNARATHSALLKSEKALTALPVLGREGGDLVPLALLPHRAFDETAPPSWLAALRTMLADAPSDGWGSARKPVFVTSSNFGVGNLYAFRRGGYAANLAFGAPSLCVHWLQRELGWGANVTILSHACVSAHLGLVQASRVVSAGLADEAMVFSFDFLSPFVAGGFHALKILNADFPAPYAARPTGAIGLGDGAAFAVVTRDRGEFALLGQSLFNELHHFTANQPDGAGFKTCLAPMVATAGDRRLWLKGHGTGTLEAGRLEATALAESFPGAALVGWKGSLGHTLGSCGLVELAIAAEAMRSGRAPGTVGTTGPVLANNVAPEAIDVSDRDAVLCTSNAFGGAHAALLLAPAREQAPRGTKGTDFAATWSDELFITAVECDDPGREELAATRERLKTSFGPGATRRMTQLGMLVGRALHDLGPTAEDVVVYASTYGESRALEGYLDSFPQASPTLFQTSIHPSGAQQALIGRQRSLRELFPLSGDRQLPAQALVTAALAGVERVLLCGGEERGTWLLERGVASDRTFAFACALNRTKPEHFLGRIRLSRDDEAEGQWQLAEFFDVLRRRENISGLISPGMKLELWWS